MKTKNIHSLVALLITFGMLTFSSCRKKEEEKPDTTDTDTEQATANDNNLAEGIVHDIEAMGSDASENMAISAFKSSGEAQSQQLTVASCATVTIANKIITVDFGTSGCTGGDGRTRTGKLIYDYSTSSPATAVYYRNPGFRMVVTSQNYVVDGNQVNITNKIIANTTPTNIPNSVNPGTNLSWSINANVTIIKANNSGTITWTCNRTKELMNTADTLCYRGQNKAINWQRAMVKLNGNASGTNANNESYNSVATNLVRDFNCTPNPTLRPNRHPFVSGTIAYTPANRYTRLVNYGSGVCDNDATVTINGTTYNITLP